MVSKAISNGKPWSYLYIHNKIYKTSKVVFTHWSSQSLSDKSITMRKAEFGQQKRFKVAAFWQTGSPEGASPHKQICLPSNGTWSCQNSIIIWKMLGAGVDNACLILNHLCPIFISFCILDVIIADYKWAAFTPIYLMSLTSNIPTELVNLKKACLFQGFVVLKSCFW